jgi:hypothetical protein
MDSGPVPWCLQKNYKKILTISGGMSHINHPLWHPPR